MNKITCFYALLHCLQKRIGECFFLNKCFVAILYNTISYNRIIQIIPYINSYINFFFRFMYIHVVSCALLHSIREQKKPVRTQRRQKYKSVLHCLLKHNEKNSQKWKDKIYRNTNMKFYISSYQYEIFSYFPKFLSGVSRFGSK